MSSSTVRRKTADEIMAKYGISETKKNEILERVRSAKRTMGSTDPKKALDEKLRKERDGSSDSSENMFGSMI